MNNQFESALSSHDERSISVREKDLTDEVMDEMGVAAALYYLWTGVEPTDGQRRLVDAMLTSLMVHGKTPSAIAGRLTQMSAPEAPQAAIASGILGVGDRFIGSMLECAEQLDELVAADDTEAAVATLVADSRATETAFPGLGHPHLQPVDPRAERLFDIAAEEDIAGEHTAMLRVVQSAFEDEVGSSLPINVTGAIAALTADIGLSPTAARGLAVISRAIGVTGEVLEEQENPIGPDIWAAVDEQTTSPDE
ncbi:MAG: citryl-CoA lyase [Haloarculaceae archaeon]